MGCGQGACFHPPKRGAVVGETPCGSGQMNFEEGGGVCGSLQHLCKYYLLSSPTTQANNFYHFGNDKKYF